MTDPYLIMDQPARHSRAVVFNCDDGYLPFAVCAANAIDRAVRARGDERDFDICIVSATGFDPLPESLDSLDLRTGQFDGLDDMFTGPGFDSSKTVDYYARLALPGLLADDYDRILYLDSDIFVQGGDFSALMSIDLAGRPLAAVRDNMQWRTPERRPASMKRNRTDPVRYLNSGMLLIDTAAWSDLDMLPRMLELGSREEAGPLADQDVLNVVLNGEWAELSPVWNWQYTWASRFVEAMQTANIVHFIGPRKPWRDAQGQLPQKFIRTMAAFQSEHWPDSDTYPHRPGPALDASEIRRQAWKLFLGAPAMARYLARFPHDLTVHP